MLLIGLNASTFFLNIARIGGLGDNFIGVRVHIFASGCDGIGRATCGLSSREILFLCPSSFFPMDRTGTNLVRKEKNSPPFTIDVIGKQKNVARPVFSPSALCPTSFLSHVPSKGKKANLGKRVL